MKIFSNISFSLIGLLYIIIIGGLCYVLPIPEMVKGFLALPGYLIIPYLVGNTSFYVLKYFLRIDGKLNKISSIIMYWCIGIVVITLVALFLESIYLFNIHSYIGFLVILIIFGIIKDISISKYVVHNDNITSHKNYFYSYKNVFPLLLSLLIGIIPAIFITYFSPFPFIYGIDVFIHNMFSGTIINYGHFFLDSPYFPTFHIMGAITQIIFNMTPNQMPFFWTARFLTYPLYSIGIYLLLYRLSKDNKLSLLGSIIAVWFTVYNPPFIDIALFYYTPKIVVWLLFPFLLYLIYVNLIDGEKIFKFKNKEIALLLFIPLSYILFLFLIDHFIRVVYDIYTYIVCSITLIYLFILRLIPNKQLRMKIFIFIIAYTPLFFFHKPMGLLAIIIILFWFFVSVFVTRYKSKSVYILYLFMLFVILYFFLQFYDVVQFSQIYTRYIVGGERAIWPETGNFHYLVSLITTSYLPSLFIFFYFGIISALVYKKLEDLQRSLIFTTFFIIFMYFLPIKFMERLLPFVVPFLSYFISLGTIKIANLIHRQYKSNYISCFFFTLIIVITVTTIITPYIYTINKVIPPNSQYFPYFTFYSEEEYKAYDSLDSIVKNNKTIIISDSLTKWLAAGISQKDVFAGGTVYREFVEQQEMDIFLTNNSKDTYNKINFLLSNRTFTCYWHVNSPQRCDNQQPTAVIIIHPRTEGMYKALYPDRKPFKVDTKKFYNSTFFTLIYSDDKNKIYIFGVNPEPGIPFKIQNNTKFK